MSPIHSKKKKEKTWTWVNNRFCAEQSANVLNNCWFAVESGDSTDASVVHLPAHCCWLCVIKLKLQILHMKNLFIYPWRHKNLSCCLLCEITSYLVGECGTQRKSHIFRAILQRNEAPLWHNNSAREWGSESSHFQLSLLTRLPVFSCKKPSRTSGRRENKEKNGENIFFPFFLFSFSTSSQFTVNEGLRLLCKNGEWIQEWHLHCKFFTIKFVKWLRSAFIPTQEQSAERCRGKLRDFVLLTIEFNLEKVREEK